MPNQPPLITPWAFVWIRPNQVVPAASLFAVQDVDGDSIVRYTFMDGGVGGGYFTVNGAQKPALQSFVVEAADLYAVNYVGAAAAGSEELWVGAYDGIAWSAIQNWLKYTVNSKPVVNPNYNPTVQLNQTVAVSGLFYVYDNDGDSISQYRFQDDGAGGGYFTVNGVAQAASQGFTVSAAELANVRYVGGAVGGSELLWVQAFDGYEWGAWQSWTQVTRNLKPVVYPALFSVRPNQIIAAPTMFGAYDLNGDPITQYQFSDLGPAGGYFTINGVRQTPLAITTVNASDLGVVSYVGAAAISIELLQARAFDGYEWGDWLSWTMSTYNTKPQLNTMAMTLRPQQSVVAATLFNGYDPDGDLITQYQFWDDGAGGGYFTLNGVRQAALQGFTVNAANLGAVNYVGGATEGSEVLWARVYDGYDWSDWQGWNQVTQNLKPVIFPTNTAVRPDQATAVTALFFAMDANGDAIAQYQFWDEGVGGGYFTVNGVRQAALQNVTVSAANLATVNYVGGPGVSNEVLWARAHDGLIWGDWQSWITYTVNNKPVAAPILAPVRPNQSVQATTLFYAYDSDGDAITQYQFWDDGVGGGYFTVSGVRQAALQNVTVSAANLATVNYVGGPGAGNEILWARAHDGLVWGDWQSWTTYTVNNKPVAIPTFATVRPNQIVPASSLFSAYDADGDAITQYQFWDDGAGGGFFTVNGVRQAALQNVTVSAANLGTVNYVGGAGAGSERLWVKAFDAFDGGAWQDWITVTQNSTPLVTAPLLTVASVLPNQTVAATSMFRVTDADGDTITQYQFWDDGASGGYFTVSGAQQAALQGFTVNAANLATVNYVGGALEATEVLWVRAHDGFEWGAWKSWNAITQPNKTPVIAAPDASARPNQVVAASSLFSATDANGDNLTQYQFWDDGTGGGYFTVNGARQAALQGFVVNATGLSAVNYVGGAGAGTELLWVRANDGVDWGVWESWSMATRNTAPAITVMNSNTLLVQNEVVPVYALFRATDADSDPITQYRFVDTSLGGGYFTINGQQQAPQQNITVNADSLRSMNYVANAGLSNEILWVQAYDGYDWGPWQYWNTKSIASPGLVEHVGTANPDFLSATSFDNVYYGLQGNDTLSGWGALLLGGTGDDRYEVYANDDSIVYENGNSADDTLSMIGIGFSFNSAGSFAAVVDGINLLVGYQTQLPGTLPVGVLLVDWQNPANRIETFQTNSGTFTYDQFVSALSTFPNLVNISWEDSGINGAEIREAFEYYGQKERILEAQQNVNVQNLAGGSYSASMSGAELSLNFGDPFNAVSGADALSFAQQQSSYWML